jgi:hypothetical protein
VARVRVVLFLLANAMQNIAVMILPHLVAPCVIACV